MSNSNSKTNPLVWVAIGCGGLMVLAALVVLFGGLFFSVSSTSVTPPPSPSPSTAPAAPGPPAPPANPSER
jgi:hypothetical protein